MLWFKAFITFLFISLSLYGCGFSPLYSTASNHKISEKLSNIKISNIPDRNGQYLRNLLLDSFYSDGIPDKNATYLLQINSLNKEIIALGIKKDASATRAQMRTDLTITLIDQSSEDQKKVFTRKLRSINSFNILDSQYATKVSEQKIEEQSLKDLSKQIIREISLYFKNPRVRP